jgi:hypothetical protein
MGAVADLDRPETALWHGLRAVLRHPPLTARSCKLRATGISDRRFLLTFPRAALLAPDAPAPLAALVGGHLPPQMTRHWTRADVLHLGIDAEDDGIVRKLYLEFPPDDQPEPGLTYLALKCAGGRQAVHRYDRVAEGAALLAALDLPDAVAAPARALAALSDDLLQVSEPGSPRLSLDIGLADLPPDAATIRTVARLVAAINPTAPLPFTAPSHVAIGRDRTGAPFVTLYGWPEDGAP